MCTKKLRQGPVTVCVCVWDFASHSTHAARRLLELVFLRVKTTVGTVTSTASLLPNVRPDPCATID